ncbi:Protein MOR1 [Hibiscus syriacus]|uniref:Protein MOR1 n=1 Tax=Hibiscus syriacus TaxID=106335 RepID=A0A6A2WHX7_HIBSY|nr:Protein MOR1 [Hibiscus syriacus]
MSEEEKLLKEAKKLPWEDRLLHKNWKVRNEANIDLASFCDSITDPKDPRLREIAPFFRKTVADSNAPVQEKALDALIAFLKAADADAGRYAKEVCDAIVVKCLTGRPKTVEKAQGAFMLWVELEAVDVFLDSMEKAIKNKVAKAVVPAIDVMFQALSEFGAKVVPPKRILKMLPELFDHQDQNVRASSKGLTLELCRWIGKDPVKSILFEKMRDTMKKELEAELVNVTGTAKPSRKIRSEQDKEPEPETVSEAAGPGSVEESEADAPVEIDEYELVDPVDILTPLEKSGFWDGVKATKWSERKEAVAELTKLASTKKIAPGDFAEVCRTLKKLVTDVNIAVAVESIQAIGNLARDVKTATKNKVPLVRSLTLNWVTFCIETSNKAVVLKVHKDYVPICMECLNDGTPDVRDAAFSVLTAVAKSVGMRPLERSLEKLDDVRKKKLSEMIAGSGSVSGATSSAAVKNTGGGVSSTEASEGSFVRKSAASMLSGKRPVSAAPANKKVASVKSGNIKKVDGAGRMETKKLSEKPEDIEPAEMSLEEIESKLGSLIQEDVISQMKSAVWKERLEAISSLKQQVEGLQDLDRSVEILIYLLCTLPGWNEKNVQVQQQVIEVITYLASSATKFPKKCVVLCLLGVSERVADMKTRAHAMKCLTSFCEAIGPGFVFERLYKIMKEHKNPKVLSEGLLWMVSAIDDFGVSHLKLKDLIDFCKDTGLQSSAAATRNATIKLLGALHKFIGPDIKGFLSDVKPALLSALDVEYQKNPFEGTSAVPKKTVRALESTSLSVGGLDSLPREDISGKLTPTLLKSLESPDWKVRLESIEAVNKILEEANKRIQPTGTGELFGALRGRLYDSNKNLVMATLTTIGNVASAMGPAVEKASKGILSDILKCVSDNKKHMREGTLSTLDAWNAAAHFDKMVPYITSALTDTKIGAEGRKDLFDWSARQLSGLSEFPDAVHLLKPAATAMMDKSSDVRKAADGCIAEILRVSGQETIEKNLKDIQGPALALILERVKPYGSFQEFVEPPKGGSIGLSSKTSTKVAKSTSNGVTKHGNRTVTLRAVPAKGLKPDTLLPVQGISVQPQALLNVKDSNKEERERMVRRSKFEELRVEQIQELESDMMKYFREDLHRRMLSTDFKKQVDGLEMLQKALPSIGKEIIEVLDILLRWFVLQLCKSNTTCLLKVLEFLPELFNSLKDEAYNLSEAEAAIFLPCLVEKLGHNIEKVREKMRELTKQIVQVYSAAKSYTYILDGLRSKNNRTRIECADLVGFFIDHHGPEISGQLKSLQIVASLTAERDGEIRKAALNALATGYKILGEDIWRYVGKLTDAQKSMLDDRFKWKVREMEKRGEGRPGEARAALRRSIGAFFPPSNLMRNAMVFEGILLDRVSLFFIVRFRLAKWFHAKFPVDFLKMNVDGAVRQNDLGAGIGGLLRDWNGCTLLTFSESIGQAIPPLAELKAIKRGMDIFLYSRWASVGRLIVESDCSSAVEWIQSPTLAPIFFSPIVYQISSLICGKVHSVRPDVAEQSCEVSQSIPRKNFVQSDLNMERHIMPHALVGVSGPTNWIEALDTISFGSPEQSVEGMKVVCHELTQATNDPEGSLMDELMKDADRLVAKTFDFSLTGASSRSCKYVLNTLMQTFQNKRLAHAVKENTLDNLITELLLWLLDERVPHMDDGSQLLKALNVLMLKILDNADRTSSFVVLINLLRPLDPSRWPSPATNETFAARNQKFSDLVVKCLIKLTKVLQSTIYDVDLDRILQSIHVYLQELGMEEIRRRAGADDKPLRMVKTVLHEIVKLRGAAIKGHLSLVPIDMKPPPIILAYIDLNLETLAAARMLTSTGPGQTHWGDSGVNNPAPATNSADAQLKQELAAIFKKIGDKQTCTIGLYELYRITQLYPKVDIFAQLQNASEAFRTYIRDGLAQMEKNAAAGRTPSSVPMATPPPASLNASSPEFAPLSPVQTNSLNDSKSLGAKPEPTNFNLPPSYTEDNRGSGNAINTARVRAPENALADQRNERLMSGVTSGTLDAIRERMKSMQLAAAGGNIDEYATRPLMSVNDKLNAGLSTQTRALDPHPGMDNPTPGGVLPMDEKALSGLQARMERLKSGGPLEPL